MELLEFTLEFGVWGGHYQRLPGASWRATLIDPAVGQRYSGSDDCPWAAMRLALEEREMRRAGRHSMARTG